MNLIVAVDKNWAIGCNGDLLVSIPADKKFFRTETTGKAIIMGRKTLESFPNGQPLKDRTNIVITRKRLLSEEVYHINKEIEKNSHKGFIFFQTK